MAALEVAQLVEVLQNMARYQRMFKDVSVVATVKVDVATPE